MRWIYLGTLGVVAAALSATLGCSATSGDHVFGEGGSGAGGGSSASSSTGGTSLNVGAGGGFVGSSAANGAGGGSPCSNPPGADGDMDGFTSPADCNDCDPNINPGAIDIANPDPMGPVVDEDCDGVMDNGEQTCDDMLGLADVDPNNGARAIDLCQFTTAMDPKWGVLAANYVRANGTVSQPAVQAGILDSFGPSVNVQGGARMLMLSSGAARVPGQPGECLSQTCLGLGPGTPPPGFPQDVPNCSGSTAINDDMGLEVRVRSPKNATGYQFLFKFHSFEFPEWVCTSYNDQFIALVSPPPTGSINGNISFDSNTNPVSVNIAFFDVCDPAGIGNFASLCFSGCPSPPNPYCPSGTAELTATGFDVWGDAGGTSWLKTQAPVTGGDEVTIRFAIWDTGDQALDSSVLVDQFKWIANGGTITVGTEPIPNPH
jgi:hypothetical protein